MDTMNQSYQKAIDILMKNEFHPNDVVVELAKVDPALFVSIVERVSAPVFNPAKAWMRDVIELLFRTEVVNAIKTTRLHTNFGLKEAKDIIDNVRLHLHNVGYLAYQNGSTATPLDSMRTEFASVANEIIEISERMRKSGELGRLADHVRSPF